MKTVEDVLWLRSLKGFGNKTVQKLHRACEGDFDRLHAMDLQSLKRLKVLSEAQALDLINQKENRVGKEHLARCKEAGIAVVTPWGDTENGHLYPESLRHIYDSPVLLYMKGRYELLGQKGIAVVGTRNPMEQSLLTAREFSKTFSKAGKVIVSGLAEGIDAAAHLGGLEAEGSTIAVLGSGIDHPYPAGNIQLYHAICKKGLVVSEHPPGTKPQRGYFAKRNRIISGLSEGILVVEAGWRSGALITAHYGLDQGKSLFAIPGSIRMSRHQGCHNLIREGAQLVSHPAQILEELGLSETWHTEALEEEVEKACYHGLYGELWNKIKEQGPVMLEELLEGVKADRATVFQYTLDLMLDGAIERGADGAFRALS